MRERVRLGANYWKLWTASAVSNFGDGLATVAYPWLASAITRDPIQIALVGVATRLPWLIFTLPAGVITDRADRRKLIAAMDVTRFGITLGVALFVTVVADNLIDPTATDAQPSGQTAYLAVLYVSALAFGFAEVLRDNAAQTLMPALVPKAQLERANGRLWGAEMVMNSFVGPPIGGLLIGLAFALPFYVDAATFAVSALLIGSLSGTFRVAQDTATAQRSFRSDIVEGVKWLWRHRLLRVMAIVLGVMNAMFAMALATYVLFVQEILGLEAASFGVLLSAGAVGGVVGSVLASRVSSRVGPGASLFTSIALSGLTFAVTGFTSSAVVVWAMFVVSSFAAVLWNVITVSLRQSIIPDRLLGRVNSVYRFFAWGMMPIGSVIGGVLVAVVEPVSDRATALRTPFWAAAVIFGGLFVYVLPNLNSARIAEATAAAEAAQDQS
ncbi:MAG TPA: MFS transporter [Acidimicrobiia bacterium]|nr:MFS transporter [Acidimicrobiia bacterium]